MKHNQQTKDRCYQLRAAGAIFDAIARVCNIFEKTARTWCHSHTGNYTSQNHLL